MLKIIKSNIQSTLCHYETVHITLALRSPYTRPTRSVPCTEDARRGYGEGTEKVPYGYITGAYGR